MGIHPFHTYLDDLGGVSKLQQHQKDSVRSCIIAATSFLVEFKMRPSGAFALVGFRVWFNRKIVKMGTFCIQLANL